MESGALSWRSTIAKRHRRCSDLRFVFYGDALKGYAALLKSAFSSVPIPYGYVFTDWRMWVNLFDVMESSGFGVRSMIVWDKGHPGMGMGWRSQHELIMWAAKKTPPFDRHASGVGNVLQEKRTGNPLHTTQKPVEILARLMQPLHFVKTVYDPFTGAATTIIACEQLGRKCRAMEIDPGYVAVSIQRWADATGKTPKLLTSFPNKGNDAKKRKSSK